MARNAAGKDGADEMPTHAEAEALIDDEFEGLEGATAESLADDEGEEVEGGEGQGAGDDDDDAIAATETLDDDDDEGQGERAEGDADGDRGDGRRKDGTFVPKKDEAAAGDTAAADAGKGGKAGDQAAAAPAGDDQWKPFSVKADKAIVPIEGAFQKTVKDAAGNEFVVISVPKADAGRFTDRIARGHLLERRSREIEDYRSKLEKVIADIDREQALEKDAPKGKSDSEIEAELLIDAIQKKLADEGSDFSSMFTALELENLELRVASAQAKAKTDHATARTTYFEEKNKPLRDKEAAETEERTLQAHLIETMFSILKDEDNKLTAEQKSAVDGLDEPQLRAALESMLRLRRDANVGAIWKEQDGGYYVNSGVILDALANAKRSSTAATAPARTAAPSATEPTADGKGGKGGKSSSTADDRHNRGVESAARPRSTSLRDQRDSRPRSERPTRERAGAGAEREGKTASMIQEDSWNATKRKLMKSDSLDFDDDEEG